MKIDLTNKNDYEIISLYLSSEDEQIKEEIVTYIYFKFFNGLKKLCRKYVTPEYDLDDTLQDAYLGVCKTFQYTNRVTCDPSIFRMWTILRSHVSTFLKNRNRYVILRRFDTISLNSTSPYFSETFEAVVEDKKYNVENIVLGKEYVEHELAWVNSIKKDKDKYIMKMMLNNYNYTSIGRKIGTTKQAVGLRGIKLKKDYISYMKDRGLL